MATSKEELVLCPRCNGEGCKMCKQTGWVDSMTANKWNRDHAPPGDTKKKGGYM